MEILSQQCLLERVKMIPEGCWVWTGAKSKDGYGVMRWENTQRTAPRIFWESFVSPIPPGYRVIANDMPGCVGRACCNPSHHRLQGRVVETASDRCKEGHLLTPDNVVIENRKGRKFKRCRICRREAWRSWQRQSSSAGVKSSAGKPAK